MSEAVAHSDTTSISDSTASVRRPVAAMPETLGRYRLTHPLGCGGSGRVFAGHDPKLDRPVAIKVFHLPTSLTDVEREGTALANLAHPNVLAVHDVGDADGIGYLVMDLAPGGTLAEFIRRGHAWREIVDVFVQVGRGLAVVHGAGLAHGDIKPTNILIDRDGRPLLADFGLASASGSPDAPRGGTRLYMSPERLAGHPPSAASDQFELALTMWEALHRVRPWESNTASTISSRAPRRGRLLSDLPPAIDRTLQRALAVDPRDRFENVGALVDALTRVITDADRRRARRRTITIALASFALAGLLDRCV